MAATTKRKKHPKPVKCRSLKARRRRAKASARCAPPKPRKPAKAKKPPISSGSGAKGVPPVLAPMAVKPKPASPPVVKPAPAPTAPPTATPTASPSPSPTASPSPSPAPTATPGSPLPVYSGPFGLRQAQRLLWRAGFGPAPGQAEALAKLGLAGAVQSLTRPSGSPTLTGPAPTVNGAPIRPYEVYCHDFLWWLDRMVRTDQPLVERMAFIWHDWFPCRSDQAGGAQLLMPQNQLFRSMAFGSFEDLAVAIAKDPAMVLQLNLDENWKGRPNENFARELMELFTLGADSGAYTEDDVREAARACTGWRRDWSEAQGNTNFRIDPGYHDDGVKTIFGQSGRFTGEDLARMCVRHPKHAAFFVKRLWGSFIPTPPSAGDQAALERLYVQNGRQVRPVLEAILLHPDFHTGPSMVKPPIVLLAGVLRAIGRPVDTDAWVWITETMGQKLFWPPDVAGWREDRWLDTKSIPGRWAMVAEALKARQIIDEPMRTYDATETGAQALASARAFWSDPLLTDETLERLRDFADTCLPVNMVQWETHQYRASRQNALRQLVAAGPDYQVC